MNVVKWEREREKRQEKLMAREMQTDFLPCFLSILFIYIFHFLRGRIKYHLLPCGISRLIFIPRLNFLFTSTIEFFMFSCLFFILQNFTSPKIPFSALVVVALKSDLFTENLLLCMARRRLEIIFGVFVVVVKI